MQPEMNMKNSCCCFVTIIFKCKTHSYLLHYPYDLPKNTNFIKTCHLTHNVTGNTDVADPCFCFVKQTQIRTLASNAYLHNKPSGII